MLKTLIYILLGQLKKAYNIYDWRRQIKACIGSMHVKKTTLITLNNKKYDRNLLYCYG